MVSLKERVYVTEAKRDGDIVIHAPVIGQKGRQRRIDDRQLLLLIFPDILLLFFEIRNRAAPKY
ncbi:MAG: hypothetical protein MJ210_03295, partial [Alphaproteobacteria bacterium]|nr:hypothetical protein [Alphaproteobacteria bacterium]